MGAAHPQLRRLAVHLLHKHRLGPADVLGHCHGRVVGAGNADGLEHLIQGQLLPRLQPNLAAAHVVGVFAHRHNVRQRRFAALQRLHGEQQGHHLGDGGNGHRLVRLFFIQHGPAGLIHKNGRPAGQVEFRQFKASLLLGKGGQGRRQSQHQQGQQGRSAAFHGASSLCSVFRRAAVAL